jgi:hypothetical protein
MGANDASNSIARIEAVPWSMARRWGMAGIKPRIPTWMKPDGQREPTCRHVTTAPVHSPIAAPWPAPSRI